VPRAPPPPVISFVVPHTNVIGAEGNVVLPGIITAFGQVVASAITETSKVKLTSKNLACFTKLKYIFFIITVVFS
jgi:hypothetical protein